jgi:GAF domain-containing protein
VVPLAKWKERSRLTRTRAPEPEPPEPNGRGDDDLVSRFRQALMGVTDAREGASALFDELERIPNVDAVVLALVENGKWATGFAARGLDEDWWRGVSVDCEHEAGGISTVVRERTAYAVYDVESAPNINRRLASIIGAKSAGFVPLIAEDQVVGVIVLIALRERRFFSSA